MCFVLYCTSKTGIWSLPIDSVSDISLACLRYKVYDLDTTSDLFAHLLSFNPLQLTYAYLQ